LGKCRVFAQSSHVDEDKAFRQDEQDLQVFGRRSRFFHPVHPVQKNVSTCHAHLDEHLARCPLQKVQNPQNYTPFVGCGSSEATSLRPHVHLDRHALEVEIFAQLVFQKLDIGIAHPIGVVDKKSERRVVRGQLGNVLELRNLRIQKKHKING